MIATDTVLLAGLPRSGTTLTCMLLNELTDTVALAEPIALHPHGDRERAVREIDAFIVATRRQALAANEAVSKHVDGVIPDNWVEPPSDSPRLRRVLETRGAIRLGKPLTPNFRLVIKHPAEFSALSDLLRQRYTLAALVRHPLAVLASWQTVDMPVNQGHMPMAEAFNPSLAAALAAHPGRLQRQIALLEWLLDLYSGFPPEHVVRYEDLVSSPRSALSLFSTHANESARALSAYDPVARYPSVDMNRLAREVRSIRSTAEKFYPGFEETLAPWLAAAAP